MAKPLKTDDKEFEKLGRMLVKLLDNSIKPGKGYYRAAFLKGVLGGLGGVIGATVLVALLVWILSFFDSISFVNNFVETIRNSSR